MAERQGMKKKEDFASIFNRIIEQAVASREGFTPDVMRRFEDEGRRSREERQRQQVREATPVRQSPVARRAEEAEQQRAQISPHMRQRGIEEAVRCGEMMELAVAGRRPRTEWATS
ncbi:MAG TPA: hypothetical protein VLD37_02800 [Candidatus Bilamarchaeum sp.]|nr:hypothetical protein [Candidatus Bilamarchaeum sp.]